MKYLNFIEGKAWNYDPYHIFSNLRVTLSSTPYIDHANPNNIKTRKQGKLEKSIIIYAKTSCFITCKSNYQEGANMSAKCVAEIILIDDDQPEVNVVVSPTATMVVNTNNTRNGQYNGLS